MHRLVRIEGLHDFKVGNTLKFVLYDGSKYITLKGYIHSNRYICFFGGHCDLSEKLFSGFGIKDRIQYCKKFDDKCSTGYFPEHSSLDALKKTILSLFDLNTDIIIPSKYKVGDKVVIRSKYHSGSNGADYLGSFVEKMLKLGGTTVTISGITDLSENKIEKEKKHYYEPYLYHVKENAWTWSSEMFKNSVKDSKMQIREIRRYDSEAFTVTFTDNSTQNLTVRDFGFLSGHNLVFKTCGIHIADLSHFLNEELDCVRNTAGYEPYIDQEENIWIFIDDLKYRFGTEECKKTINPEFYKHLKKKPKQGIIEQIEYSQAKTQGNAYQFCKRRGTVCRGDVPEGRTVQGKRSKASVSSRSLEYRAVIGQ